MHIQKNEYCIGAVSCIRIASMGFASYGFSRMVFLVLCFHAVWHPPPPKCGFTHSQFFIFWGGFVCYLKAFHFSFYSSAAWILGVRSPWWLNLAWWHMMFVGPQFGCCIISPFWCLELWGSSNFGNYLHLCCTVSMIVLYSVCWMLSGCTLFVLTEYTDNLNSS